MIVHFSYRIAIFWPNPTVPWRLPFAVFVEFGGACFVGIARLLPDARYLGSEERAVLLDHGIRMIKDDPWAYRGHDLAGKFGPHFGVGSTGHLETSDFDVVQWAVDNLLPH